jgi:hypothetical protein
MHTTQYAQLPTGTTLKWAFKSPNPALYVTQLNEPIACNIVYADVPALYQSCLLCIDTCSPVVSVTPLTAIVDQQ